MSLLSALQSPRQVAQFAVKPIGLGCMNLDHAYGPSVSPEQGERVLLARLMRAMIFLIPPRSMAVVKTKSA